VALARREAYGIIGGVRRLHTPVTNDIDVGGWSMEIVKRERFRLVI